MNKVTVFLLIVVLFFLKSSAEVTLTESQVDWKTFRHTVNSDYSLLNDTFSMEIETHTYKSLVMENEYLRVTLVPEYGGRIISLIYKPTGHEQLYQNPVGRPYGPQWDAFYYDWLMVWGGIFPTFPEPEHGNAWCRPWAYKITSETAEKVSVKMSITDDINFPKSPSQFKYGTTNITCHFEVTLSANTSALKTSVTLVNPNSSETEYEYWTNVGVAPGSVPGSSQCDDQTELVGPISSIKIDEAWPEIQQVENKVNGDIYEFDNLRWYKNWAADGIAYAWPVEGNFWGALNHANKEALLRISENVKTPGLKLWGFGYNQSRGFNPETNNEYRRPFIEMWAGASKEFFSPATLEANGTLQFEECYVPTVGLTSFTHASEHAVIALTTDKKSYNGNSDAKVMISCNYVLTRPTDSSTILLQFRGGSNAVTVHEETKTHQGNGPFMMNDTITVENLCDDIDRLVFELKSGDEVMMSSEIPVSFANAGTCKTSVVPDARRLRKNLIRTETTYPQKLYSISGVYLGEARGKKVSAHAATGVILSVDRQGRCSRSVRMSAR